MPTFLAFPITVFIFVPAKDISWLLTGKDDREEVGAQFLLSRFPVSSAGSMTRACSPLEEKRESEFKIMGFLLGFVVLKNALVKSGVFATTLMEYHKQQ